LYADSSYGIHKDGKSHTGVVVRYGNSTVSTFCKKQSVITRSSTEAEIVALNDGVSIVMFMKQIFEFISECSYTPIVYQDNQSVIGIIKNDYNARSKHLNVKYNYAKQLCINKDIVVMYVSTHDMIADILTKPLYGNVFIRLCIMLLNQ